MTTAKLTTTAEFRPVPDFPAYQITNFGRIQSCYVRARGRGRVCTWVESEGWRDLKGSVDRQGYLRVKLRRDGKKYPRGIHRLVLEAFVGQCPDGMQCRHLDGNPRNNQLSNLRWGFPEENYADRDRHGTTARGERNGLSRLREENIPEIFRLCESGMTCREIAARFGVSGWTIGAVLTGRTWAHISEPLGICVSHGRPVRGERVGGSRLREEDISEIFRLRESGMSQRSIAERFGVSRSNIGWIVTGKSWAHVSREAPESPPGRLRRPVVESIHLGPGRLLDEIAALWGRGAIGLGEDFWR